jgi:hypothetical protein
MSVTMDSRSATPLAAATPSSPTGPDSLAGHLLNGAQPIIAAEGSASPQSIVRPKSTDAAPAGTSASHGQESCDTHLSTAVAVSIPGGHPVSDAHIKGVAGDSDPVQSAAITRTTPILWSPLTDPLLSLAADVLDDLEKARISNENRLRQLTRSGEDSDGETRGFGLDESHPDVARLAALVDMLGDAEHKAELNLGRVMRQHPLGPWVQRTAGLGVKQMARLIASIGDPYVRPERIAREDGTVEPSRPRLVSELWAYCGYHVLMTPVGGQQLNGSHSAIAADGRDFPADHSRRDTHTTGVGGEQDGHPAQSRSDAQTSIAGVAPKRARGQKANWSATAKMRAYLVAVSCMKCLDSPYRKVYDDAREKYADAVHQASCIRCGPSGKPADEGSPLSDGHKHARALRAVAKAVLKDLWREAKRLHEEHQTT